jgi:hypothetical protein
MKINQVYESALYAGQNLSPYLTIHFVVYLTAGQKRLSMPVLHRVRSDACYMNFQYLFLSLRSSGSCFPLLHLLPFPSK